MSRSRRRGGARRWMGRAVLVVGGLVAGILAGAVRRRPVPPAVQAADPRPGQA